MDAESFRDELDVAKHSYYYVHENGKEVRKDFNEEMLSFVERSIRGVEKAAQKLEIRFTEIHTLDDYNLSKKIITPEEYARTQQWYKNVSWLLVEIVKRHRGFRAHKSMSPEEYDVLYNHIKDRIHELRELIRDRYEVEKDIEQREELKKVLGT
jgi:DNA polymerase II small subunit/DNA polymerase delta subunit B